MSITWRELLEAMQQLSDEQLDSKVAVVCDDTVDTVCLGWVDHERIKSMCYPTDFDARQLDNLDLKAAGLYDVEIPVVLVME